MAACLIHGRVSISGRAGEGRLSGTASPPVLRAEGLIGWFGVIWGHRDTDKAGPCWEGQPCWLVWVIWGTEAHKRQGPAGKGTVLQAGPTADLSEHSAPLLFIPLCWALIPF